MGSFINKRVKGFEIIAHRGYQLLFPENTLAAFRKALDLGADGIELDVQMSYDKVPIVIHDETVDRTTNGHGPVTSMTLKELRELDAGAKFSHFYRGQKVPSLHEALLTVRQKGKMYIELKKTVTSSDLECILYEIYKCEMENYVTVISFNFEQLENFRHLNSSIPLGKLLLPGDFNIERMKEANITLACAPYQAFIEIPQLLPLLKFNGLVPNANGITNRRTARYLLQSGINILGSDMAL
ncbi:glycerophosphodiester phosphodiesterase [Desulfosporosinus youngiae]|uniref:Glycerophosphoryl diester phosphodiesterase n=1 Tax=Desulfosporosinus youngiae DSM 17734 TaxID=768710 RepID=H5XUZ8_9FIRM|nr:glycerophosphodiester phosphodiesterase family protein [Desulfosporosinus youngiae]EHQ89450.1 glycerophosphoryl diester phosphodiesterase [Desulfosporosinus youngiae DSM 17734]